MMIVHRSGKDQGRGARSSSAFKTALEAEFNVRREGRRNAITLSCTKMKDAEMPEVTTYNLEEVVIYTDSNGETVTSLVLSDEPRQPDDDLISSGIPSGFPHITRNHIAQWRCINQRISQNKPCTRTLLRNDLRAKRINVEKKFLR